jgi:hypothetical protein
MALIPLNLLTWEIFPLKNMKPCNIGVRFVAFISILASPPSVHSVHANVKVLNRFARRFTVIGVLIGVICLEPHGLRFASWLDDIGPAVCLITGPSAVAWSGDL